MCLYRLNLPGQVDSQVGWNREGGGGKEGGLGGGIVTGGVQRREGHLYVVVCSDRYTDLWTHVDLDLTHNL